MRFDRNPTTMHELAVNRALNRLLAIEQKSLPQYLHGAAPYTRRADDRLQTLLADIAMHQQAFAARIIEMLESRRALIDGGRFPLAWTDLHDLDLSLLIPRMIEAARNDVSEIEEIVAQLHDDLPAQELAQEVLGAERANLENLESALAARA